MKIYGVVGEDGGGFFVRANELDKTFEEFCSLVGTPGLELAGWQFVDVAATDAVWVPIDRSDIDSEFIDAIKRSNIGHVNELADDDNLLRAFEYDVPDDTFYLDWGSDLEEDGPRARQKSDGYRAFTAVCHLVSPIPVPNIVEEDE